MVPRIAILLGVALAGCSRDKTRYEQGLTGPGEATKGTVIRTSDSEFPGGSGLALYALPDSVRYQLSINGQSSTGETWSVIAYLDAEAVQTGRSSLGLLTSPSGVGIASLNRASGTSVVPASAGTLAFEFEKGRVAGGVTGAVPESLNATFEGVLGVVCYVPRSGVSEGGGLMSDDGGPEPVLAPDETLTNPACELVRPWAPAK
jgi:hypothetical protein